MTDETCQNAYLNLKKVDEYAKTLGITIYNIDYGFDNNFWSWHGFNKISDNVQ